MSRNHYEYQIVMEILSDFLEVLKEEAIIYWGDLILYHNKKGVPSTFFAQLGSKVNMGFYQKEETEDIVEKMNMLRIGIESNLVRLGMDAKNPTWYIYFSKVQLGYQEGNNKTGNTLSITEGSNKSDAEIIQEAEIIEQRQLETKN